MAPANKKRTVKSTVKAAQNSQAKGIEALLTERGKSHGKFSEHAQFTQDIKQAMRQGNWESLTPSQKEALEMIAHKVGRILAGNPDFQDHYDDIAGYATLVSKQISGEDL